jgi:hypothetical protein
MPPLTTRWTVSVAPETDAALRLFLGAQGMRKGDLSKFIEDAVRWRMLDHTVQTLQARNADRSPEELQALIDEACADVRGDSRAPGR